VKYPRLGSQAKQPQEESSEPMIGAEKFPRLFIILWWNLQPQIAEIIRVHPIESDVFFLCNGSGNLMGREQGERHMRRVGLAISLHRN
jgi:hypothetical protein